MLLYLDVFELNILLSFVILDPFNYLIVKLHSSDPYYVSVSNKMCYEIGARFSLKIVLAEVFTIYQYPTFRFENY